MKGSFTTNRTYTQNEIREALRQVFIQGDLSLFRPLTTSVMPNYVLSSFSVECAGHGFHCSEAITVEEVIINLSYGKKLADFLFTNYADYYDNPANIRKLVCYAVRYNLSHLLLSLKERNLNIRARYEIALDNNQTTQVTPMLHAVLNYNGQTCLSQTIPTLTQMGASLFDQFNGKYIFQYLPTSAPTDYYPNIEPGSSDAYPNGFVCERPELLRRRCNDLLFAFNRVGFKLIKDKSPIAEQFSNIQNSSARNRILDFLI